MEKHLIDAKLDSIIEFSGIEQHIDTPVKRYSSGMYVRLAFAVAAHLDSDILIADEVLAVGDAEFQKKALGKMQDLSTGEGRTVLFVSHNMGAVKQLCNQGIVLDKGLIKYSGSINDSVIAYSQGFDPNNEKKSEKYYSMDENKPFQVEKVEILNKSDLQLTEYEAQEEIKVRIHCISRSPLPNLYGCLALRNKNYDTFILCDSIEDGNDVFNNMPKGKYIVDIVIPPGILASGEYIPVLNFTSDYTSKFNVDSPMEIFRFKVVDLISGRGNNRGALTALVLKWNILR